MTPEAQTQLRTLLTAYDKTLNRTASIPIFAWLRHSHEGYRRRLRLPTLRLGLDYLLVHHMTLTTNRMRSRYQSLAANGENSEQYEANIKRLELFQASLPSIPYKRLLVMWVGVAALVALPVAKFFFKETGADGAMYNVASAAAGSNPLQLMGELFSADGLWAVAILALTLYCLAILPFTAYRWQRILFTVYPERLPRIDELHLADFARPSGGIYRLQEDVFGSVDAAPVREIPWELLGRAAALLALLPLWLLLSGLTDQVEMPGPVDLHGILGVLLLVLGVGGAFLVHQAWRNRNGEEPRVPVQKSAHATAAPSRTDGIPVAHIASLWARAAAHAIDSIIVVVIALFAGGYASEVITGVDAGLLVFLALPVSALVYSAATMLRGAHRGQTLGKQAIGLRLVTANGQAIDLKTVLVREAVLKWTVVFGIVCIYTLGAPLITTIVWSVLNKSNRAPHDLVARTIVVHAKERAPAPAMLAASAGRSSA